MSFGASPFGTVPFGAESDAGSGYQPGVGLLVFTGFTPTLNIRTFRAGLIVREVLRDAPSALRASAVIREVLRDAPSSVKVAFVVREVLRDRGQPRVLHLQMAAF